MRILLASSEVHPYSKTGGLADMVGALARNSRAKFSVGDCVTITSTAAALPAWAPLCGGLGGGFLVF